MITRKAAALGLAVGWTLGSLALAACGDGGGDATGTDAADAATSGDTSGADASGDVPPATGPVNLGLTLAVDRTEGAFGGQFVFTAKVSSPSDAAREVTGIEVVVRDSLRLGLLTATPAGGRYDAGANRWTIDSLAPRASAELTVIAIPGDVGTHNLELEIKASDADDPDPSDDKAKVQVDVLPSGGGVDLGVTLATSVTEVTEVPAPFDLTLTVTNDSDTAAGEVLVRLNLPQTGLSFTGLSGDGAYDDKAGLWTLPLLPPGATATATLSYQATLAGDWKITAAVSSAKPDKNPANNNTSVSLSAPAVDLTLSLSASPDTFDAVPATLELTVGVANAGPGEATDVVVALDLPQAGLTYQSLAGDGAYDATAGEVTFDAIPGGGSAQAVLTIEVGDSGAWTVQGTATSPQPEDGPLDNTTQVSFSAQSEADIALTVFSVDVTTLPATPGTFNLTINLANGGPDDATSVDVVMLGLATMGLEVTATSGDGTYDANTGKWIIGELAKDATVGTVLTVEASEAGSYTFDAIAGAALPDPDATNNTGSVTVTAP